MSAAGSSSASIEVRCVMNVPQPAAAPGNMAATEIQSDTLKSALDVA